MKRDFLQYFLEKGKTHSRTSGNQGNWKSAYEHLKLYVGGICTIADVTPEFCKGFKEYLSKTRSIGRNHKLSANTQLSYFAKLRATLNDVLKEQIITKDPCISISNVSSINKVELELFETIKEIMESRELTEFCLTNTHAKKLLERSGLTVSRSYVRKILEDDWKLKQYPNASNFTAYQFDSTGSIFEKEEKGRYYKIIQQELEPILVGMLTK